VRNSSGEINSSFIKPPFLFLHWNTSIVKLKANHWTELIHIKQVDTNHNSQWDQRVVISVFCVDLLWCLLAEVKSSWPNDAERQLNNETNSWLIRCLWILCITLRMQTSITLLKLLGLAEGHWKLEHDYSASLHASLTVTVLFRYRCFICHVVGCRK